MNTLIPTLLVVMAENNSQVAENGFWGDYEEFLGGLCKEHLFLE